MRTTFTVAERVLTVKMLQSIEYPFCVRHEVEEYILDFAFPYVKVGIEVDGIMNVSPHQMQKTCERDKNLHEMKWKIFRFTEDYVLYNTEKVVERIKDKVDWRWLAKEYGVDL